MKNTDCSGMTSAHRSATACPAGPRVLLALLLGACGAAQAQSTVTVYGKLDVGVRKAIGSADKEVATGSDSRLGFRGTEDLGNGLQAFFGFEHRFFPDTGTVDGSQFWKGYANAGLAGGFGRVGLGRQYVAAFSLAQNMIDPFGGDTVAQVRDVALRVGGITKVRINDSVRYDYSTGGRSVAVSVAESNTNGGPDRPLSVAANLKTGPWLLAAGLEDPAGANDRQWNLGAAYKTGSMTVSAGYADGRTNAAVIAKGYALGLSMQAGPAGEFKAAYGAQKVRGVKTADKLGAGYHYSLSKRTLIYADAARDGKAAVEKTAYDLGIRHNF
jgi:predicted porin